MAAASSSSTAAASALVRRLRRRRQQPRLRFDLVGLRLWRRATAAGEMLVSSDDGFSGYVPDPVGAEILL